MIVCTGMNRIPWPVTLKRSRRFDELADRGFKQIIAHAKAAVRIEFLFREEKAIGTIEVEGSTRRFP